MHIEFLRPWAPWGLLKPGSWEYVAFSLQLLLSLVLLIASRRDFANLDLRQLLLLAVCLVAPMISERLLVASFSGNNMLPAPGVPLAPSMPVAPLLGMVPVVAAGAWVGPAPALLCGLVTGVLRASLAADGIAAPFHMAFFGFLVGSLLRQDYQGSLPHLARQPIIALPLMTPFAALLVLISAFSHAAASGVAGLDYAVTLASSSFGPLLLQSVIAAVGMQSLYWFFPQLRPVRAVRQPPPYSRTLNRRLLFLFVPVVVLITFVLVYAVTAAALQVATAEVLNQMARDANTAAVGVPYFIQTGQGLLMEFASDERLWRTEEEALATRLLSSMRTVVFFDQLALLGPDGQQLAGWPTQPDGALGLTSEERILLDRGLESGAAQISAVHRSEEDQAVLSFLAPVVPSPRGGAEGPVSRVLLGRTSLNDNPMMARIIEGLQWPDVEGAGFIVDADRRIVAHPEPDLLLTTWDIGETQSMVDSVLRGQTYMSRHPRENTRRLVHYLPVDGYPWGVVVHLPYHIVLAQASRIATPLLGLQILLGGGLVAIISLVTSWVTQPLRQLADAADRIAEGDMSPPVEIAGLARGGGQDEIARVALAFEDMRQRLKDRMEDLSFLLAVSQSVSATLALPEGVPVILKGALRATGAQVARVVLLSPSGDPQHVLSGVGSQESLQDLDETLARAAKNSARPLVIQNVKRARTLLGPEAMRGPVRAIVALPIRAKEGIEAIMWVGYGTVQQFNDSDIDLLCTLASQVSVLIENARLFQTAERERKRLATILASTTDAVVVTDQEACVLLTNPAAERVFDVTSENISGQAIDRSSLPEGLIEAFRQPLRPNGALTRELALADGRTLYASLSAVRSANGQLLGRVSVIRDITHLKALDDLKSEFVATVSHDLRAPLTFMREYTEMLARVGELNQSQRDYVHKVMRGINQMSNLVDDLLALGRIEANLGLERHPCHLGAILAEAVDSRRARASTKSVTLETKSDVRANSAIVSGDAALLRQAVTNLLDNAIKYTPRGGQVMVGLSLGRSSEDSSRQATITVSDTGIGIAPEYQVRLFEKFYRVKGPDVPDVPGTGLGLSIVKSVVERHDGKIWVDSELNKGSTFTISLPLADRGTA